MKNRKKVVVRLQGGLGNQLHQFAYGFLLAKKIDAELYIDKEFLINYSKKLNITLRNFEINKFDFNYKEYKSIMSNQLFLSVIKRFRLNSFLKKIKINVVSYYMPLQSFSNDESSFYYLDGIMGINDDYENFKDFLIENLGIASNFLYLEQLAKSEIKNENSVAIHIRRTDYLKAGSIHHVLDMDYYKKAIKYIETKIENPFYYVFSDDIEFARQNLCGDNFKMINYKKENAAFFDFLAIKNCCHHIIANSTFSWWAAFLGEGKDSITVAPSVNLTTNELDIKSSYPKNWIIF